jgi:hypothetical protein
LAYMLAKRQYRNQGIDRELMLSSSFIRAVKCRSGGGFPKPTRL